MSKRFDVVLATKALVIGALSAGGFGAAEVRGFDTAYATPTNGGVGGTVLGTVGDDDEPDVDLSPLKYHYRLPITVELLPPVGAANASASLDAMASAIGAAVDADRYLAGLADWVEVGMLAEQETATPNAAPVRWGSFAIFVDFSTSSPLG